MRYAVTGATAQQVRGVGGTDIKEARKTGIIFATLNEAQVTRLRSLGCKVTKVRQIKASISPPITPPVPIAGMPTYTPLQLTTLSGLEKLRGITEPPLYGKNLNMAVIDTGIRETHELIKGHIVHSKNFTTDVMGDGFSHGTGVASIIASIAPQCGIINIKVLDKNGEGTEEEVALGIDYAMELREISPDIAPWVINLSLGGPDDGNPDNPLRVACRAAIGEGILVTAAAGNEGPDPGTIMSPACERYVGAVGSVKPDPFVLSEWSSRGPSEEGLIKPDAVLFGENIVMASSESDTATSAKSGTSFSTPFGSCLILLCQEGITRQVSYPAEVPKGLDPTVTRLFTSHDLLDIWNPRITVKPQGAAVGKDNAYGYGLPFGDLILRQFEPAIDISGLLGLVIVVGMMGMVVRSVG